MNRQNYQEQNYMLTATNNENMWPKPMNHGQRHQTGSSHQITRDMTNTDNFKYLQNLSQRDGMSLFKEDHPAPLKHNTRPSASKHTNAWSRISQLLYTHRT